MVQSKLQITGRIHLQLRGPDGKLKTERFVNNLVVQVGREPIADQLGDGSQGKMSHIGLGDKVGPTNPAQGNTQLEQEFAVIPVGVPVDRKALDPTYPTNSGIQALYRTTFLPGEATNPAITEAGIFNTAPIATGDMLARGVFTAIAKGAGDTLTVDWIVNIEAP